MSENLKKHAKKVLVIGGGVAGPAVAIRFAERGVDVDLVDLEENWGAAGTGVTLSPLTARALCELGFSTHLMDKGHLHGGLSMRDIQGNEFMKIDSPRLYSEDVPSEGGVMRPILHQMMAERMTELGVNVKTGTSFESIEQDEDGVNVKLTDGTSARYDLVIGADGLFSSVRKAVLPDAPEPRYTGQVCWRAQMKLPKHWDRGQMFFGPIKVGFTPCAPNEMYMFLLENVAEKPWYEDDELLPRLKALLAPFGGELAELRDGMDESTPIMARPLESVLVTGDWYNGRVVLIGDAVHATTPHLASGAGMAVEDAIVLVDELEKSGDYETAMQSFMKRRMPRGVLIVGNSLKLGEMEQQGAASEDMSKLMRETMEAAAEPF